MKLCPQTPSQWPEFPSSCVQTLSAMGASTDSLLDLLSIVAEELDSADLLPYQKYAPPCKSMSILTSPPLAFRQVTDEENAERRRAYGHAGHHELRVSATTASFPDRASFCAEMLRGLAASPTRQVSSRPLLTHRMSALNVFKRHNSVDPTPNRTADACIGQ